MSTSTSALLHLCFVRRRERSCRDHLEHLCVHIWNICAFTSMILCLGRHVILFPYDRTVRASAWFPSCYPVPCSHRRAFHVCFLRRSSPWRTYQRLRTLDPRVTHLSGKQHSVSLIADSGVGRVPSNLGQPRSVAPLPHQTFPTEAHASASNAMICSANALA